MRHEEEKFPSPFFFCGRNFHSVFFFYTLLIPIGSMLLITTLAWWCSHSHLLFDVFGYSIYCNCLTDRCCGYNTSIFNPSVHILNLYGNIFYAVVEWPTLYTIFSIDLCSNLRFFYDLQEVLAFHNQI